MGRSLLAGAGLLLCIGSATAGENLTSGTYSMELPLGLQAGAAYIPENNPLSADKIALGRLLYFDKRVSKDKTQSCGSCHIPYHGFADPSKTSRGVGGMFGGRNSPTVVNRLFSKEQFWDGRADDLEAQAKGPITNPVEMAQPNSTMCEKIITGIKGYGPYFKKAFGDEKVTIDRIAMAIASYERTVVSGNSPYDLYQAGMQDAMTASAVRGMTIFNGRGNCKVCHTGFNFTDESYHNLGVGMSGPKPDLGRAVITKKESDTGAFKTPTLRDVALNAPYMHDGSEATLREVVIFYNRGGTPNPHLSKEIKPLGLSPPEIDDVIAFLQALTGKMSIDTYPPDSFPD